ncbi:MAG: hypothetical protein IAG13_23735, partial [Deltaproteobacteria bacterium]|nr:hypothetical protein [Nannocystaceae bacterium]
MRTLAPAGWIALALLSACAADERDPGDPPYERLSDWGFFEGPLAELQPAADVLPYTVASPLWADFAHKGRFMQLPEGATIGFTEQDEWEFPLGTIFIKTFFFDLDRRTPSLEIDADAHIVETRLLILEDTGWESYIYVWDAAQQEAERNKAGVDVMLEYTDEAGQPASQLYLVPDQNACESCHARDDVDRVLGPITHQLNVPGEGGGENQLDLWASLGLFDTAPPPAAELPAFAVPSGDGDLDARARAYLHGNCAHCHRPGGGGG